MSVFVEVDHIDQAFPLPNGGTMSRSRTLISISKGEFISLVGSGCGKSTLLNIVAGLAKPVKGGVLLEGRQITKPGPDRMVVFQNYSLLPWLTVRENIALAVDEVMGNRPKGERRGIVEQHIDMVGLTRCGQATWSAFGWDEAAGSDRALSIRPKLLLLDEPFGALDPGVVYKSS